MSYMKVSSAAAAAVAAFALAGGAYGDPGKSPNGVPGPAGNPNPPVAQPPANAPQGPAGNAGASTRSSHGTSGTAHGTNGAHGKSGSHGNTAGTTGSRGKSGEVHGNNLGTHTATSPKSQADPTPGTPREGGRDDRPAGKITICHATKSVTNPYVEITISVNGLHGHGPAEDPHHHAGSWTDIIPAPAGGCPSQAQVSSAQQRGASREKNKNTTAMTSTTAAVNVAAAVAPEVAKFAPASQEVLGARVAGPKTPKGAAPESRVLGAEVPAGSTPKAAVAARVAAASRHGSLPFTGYELTFALAIAAAALLGGIAIRRATART
jgi:hypothetical protein